MLGKLLDFLMVLSAGGPSTLVGRGRSVDAGEAETLGGAEVIRILLGAFIVAHGLLTAFIWVSSPNADAPFRAGRSWLVGEARSLAVVAALVAAAGFVIAGVGFIADQAWWAVIGVGAGAVALVSAGWHRHQRRHPVRRRPGPSPGVAMTAFDRRGCRCGKGVRRP